MLDTLGYRKLTSKAILAHTVGGFVAGVVAHWAYVLISAFFITSSPVAQEQQALAPADAEKATSECVTGTSQADSLTISSSPVAQEQLALLLVDGEKITSEWVAGASQWTPVQADSLQGEMPVHNIVYRSVDVSVAEPGVISLNFKNNKGAALDILGVDIVDADGKLLSAIDRIEVTNDSVGCFYELNNAQGNACRMRYYVEGNAALDATSGVVTLGFVSQKKMARYMLDCRLKKVESLNDVALETKEQAVHLTLLQLLCDKYEPLLANPDATVNELETACKEIDRFLE
jgi:hypothetical protein